MMAAPSRRHVLFIGDGSFQVTAQELSSILRHRLAPVIFLINNDGYTIERLILGASSSYNDIQPWRYASLCEIFADGARFDSRRVSTADELEAALAAAGSAEGCPVRRGHAGTDGRTGKLEGAGQGLLQAGLRTRLGATGRHPIGGYVMTDPILIVGAGPTGLTAALELARMGVGVRIVDKREAPADTSRAIGIQARTLELMERRGLADEMVRLGNKGHYGSVYGGGKRVFRLDFGHVASRYDYLLFLSQAETERILRDALAEQGVQPEWRTEMVSFSQDAMSHDPSPAKAVLSKPDGSMEKTQAPWLISAEGAHSVVRTTLDLQFEGKTLDESYALGDIRLDGDLPDTDFHIFSSEHGFMGLFPMGEDHFRLIASNPLSKPEKDTEPSLEELQRIYDQRSPISQCRFHDLTWSSWFRINSRMVSQVEGRSIVSGWRQRTHS